MLFFFFFFLAGDWFSVINFSPTFSSQLWRKWENIDILIKNLFLTVLTLFIIVPVFIAYVKARFFKSFRCMHKHNTLVLYKHILSWQNNLKSIGWRCLTSFPWRIIVKLPSHKACTIDLSRLLIIIIHKFTDIAVAFIH